MNKSEVFLVVATMTVAAVLAGDDYYSEPQKRINVYVERREPEIRKTVLEYTQPKVVVKEIRAEPELKVIKKVECRQPEEKNVLVEVVKQQEQKYILKPDYRDRYEQ